MDLEKLEKNVKARGFEFFHAATAEEAVEHVLEQVQNTSVGIGGSTTVDQLGGQHRRKRQPGRRTELCGGETDLSPGGEEQGMSGSGVRN